MLFRSWAIRNNKRKRKRYGQTLQVQKRTTMVKLCRLRNAKLWPNAASTEMKDYSPTLQVQNCSTIARHCKYRKLLNRKTLCCKFSKYTKPKIKWQRNAAYKGSQLEDGPFLWNPLYALRRFIPKTWEGYSEESFANFVSIPLMSFLLLHECIKKEQPA